MSTPGATLLVGLLNATLGPQPIDWQTLLASARLDPVVLSGTRQHAYAQQDRQPVLWNDLEARWESKRGDGLVQAAALRLKPIAWGERQAFSKIRTQREAAAALRMGSAFSKALLERYRLGIRWLYQNRQQRYHRDLARVHEDRSQVQAKLAGDPRFDPQDLINSLQLKVEFEGEVMGDLCDIAELETSIRSISGLDGQVQLDTSLVPLARIETVLNSLPASVDSSFPEWKAESTRLTLAESKFSLEHTKAYSVLSYLEAGWEWDRTVQSKTDALNRSTWQNLSFGAGIRIPLFDGQTGELVRSRGDLEAAKGDFLEHRRDLGLRFSTLKAEIGSMLRRKATVDSFARRVDAGILFADYAKRADSDPLLVLKAKASSLDAQWRSEKLRLEIVESYIEILALTGRLEQGADRNQLANQP